MKLNFTIPGIPPSYNQAFKVNHFRRQIYLTQDVKSFKTRVKLSMPAVDFPNDSLFILHITYHTNWYFKNGKPRKADLQNLDKILIDAIFEKLGVDDCRVWRLTQSKVHSDKKAFTVVCIESFTESGSSIAWSDR